ncbi:MAG TPA: helix-turn-helix transcriptional regulator [Streptosporangiaceae bacterium]|nr:helix-turn-helix transcriptional regulator [Streptosporangiaceae bacterium]
MPERGSLTIGRRRLAAELRRLRELANLTGDEVAERLGWSGSKVSRIELNRIGVKSGDLTKLLDLYEVGGTHRADLLALAKAPRSKGWWEAYSDIVMPDYAAYIELEAEAEGALCWSVQLVHGLLQTEDYARAVMESHVDWMPVTPSARLRRLVEVRMARQRRLTGDRPLALSVVLDQSVLLRNMGDKQVMRPQLEHLVNTSKLDNVTLRVLPLAGAHPLGTGSFTLLAFPAVLGIGPPADVVYVEQLARNEVYADEEAAAYEYRLAFDQLMTESLEPEESRELIARVARETWS